MRAVRFGSAGSTWFHMSWNTKYGVELRMFVLGSMVPYKNDL